MGLQEATAEAKAVVRLTAETSSVQSLAADPGVQQRISSWLNRGRIESNSETTDTILEIEASVVLWRGGAERGRHEASGCAVFTVRPFHGWLAGSEDAVSVG